MSTTTAAMTGRQIHIRVHWQQTSECIPSCHRRQEVVSLIPLCCPCHQETLVRGMLCAKINPVVRERKLTKREKTENIITHKWNIRNWNAEKTHTDGNVISFFTFHYIIRLSCYYTHSEHSFWRAYALCSRATTPRTNTAQKLYKLMLFL